ncbi:MAG: hypothetical protein A2W27_04725 [Deltaproteobacteria bacterium RBG_16_44_11]|nr:MAG: hypothetical protein A2W27_04725 [Deltaproteobacteria bacterium RBG_16_44_11]
MKEAPIEQTNSTLHIRNRLPTIIRDAGAEDIIYCCVYADYKNVFQIKINIKYKYGYIVRKNYI